MSPPTSLAQQSPTRQNEEAHGRTLQHNPVPHLVRNDASNSSSSTANLPVSSSASDRTMDMTLPSDDSGFQQQQQQRLQQQHDLQRRRKQRQQSGQRHFDVVEDIMASMNKSPSERQQQPSSSSPSPSHTELPNKHNKRTNGYRPMSSSSSHTDGSEWHSDSDSSSSSTYQSDGNDDYDDSSTTTGSFDFSSIYSESDMCDHDGESDGSSYDSSSLSGSSMDEDDMLASASDLQKLLARPSRTKPYPTHVSSQRASVTNKASANNPLSGLMNALSQNNNSSSSSIPGQPVNGKQQPPPPVVKGLGELTAEGLPLAFANLKKDLEKVGRTIISSNVGGVIAERAQVLASINWLSSHVPNAVLDELGHEIRAGLKEKAAMSIVVDNVVDNDDDMSRLSDLSDAVMDDPPTVRSTHEPSPNIVVCNSALRKTKPAKTASTTTRTNPDADRSTAAPRRQGSIASAATSIVSTASNNAPRKSSNIKSRPSEVSLFSAASSMNSSANVRNLAASRTSSHDGSQSTRRRRIMQGHFKRFVKRRRDSKLETASLASRQRQDLMNDTGSLDSDDEHFYSESSVVLPQTPSSPAERSGRKLKITDTHTVSIVDENESDVDDDDYDGTNNLLERRRKQREKMSSGMPVLPSASEYQCALLFVDISGFTKISQVLDPESLSKAINSYFQLIVDEVIAGSGDLLKFAGDAVFIEWKATKELSLEHCVEAACKCASKIVSRCADFLVLANGAHGGSSCVMQRQAEKISQLNVHCGIGAGQMVGVHVGDHKLRREYLLLGQPIEQATVATDFAAMGEVAVSREAVALLAKVCSIDQTYAGMKINFTGPTIIANRSISNFTSKYKLGSSHQRKIVNALSRGVTSHVDGLEVEALKEYRRKMSLYVHPVVVGNDVAASDNFKTTRTKKSAQERHREEAELRNVYCMFVCPQVDVNVTRNEKKNRQMYKMLNDIMNLASREIQRYCGHLRQFIVDDKGLVIIITFGLRGTTVPDMVAQRALPATIAIHNALQMELGVSSRIGATIGETYCGVVGGVKRHEYAVLGPSVNLAARLMASKTNPGILVDNKVRAMANRTYGFNALPPVVAKGYKDPVPIFEPLSPLERMWGKILPNFVGRRQEIMRVLSLARDIILKQHNGKSKLVFVSGKSGVGKTTMVNHCIEHVRKLMGANKHRLLVTKNVSKESDALVPFGVFRSILKDVLAAATLNSDDRSYKSGGTFFSAFQNSIGWESLSGHSISQASIITSSKAAEIFCLVCRELDIQQAFVDHAIQHILGEPNIRAKQKTLQVRPPSPRALVSFVSRVFKRCVQDFRLAILAVDDLQFADELSWRVIREIYDTSDNVLIISTINNGANMIPRVEPNFWDGLSKRDAGTERFIPMPLGCLHKEEIAMMIMKTLGLQREEVNSDFLSGITIQSGGMPHFVNEILEYMKRLTAMDADVEISDITYESFGDLVLQRLDSFDLNTRHVLNIGAVLGQSFNSEEVIDVQKQSSDATEAAVRAKSRKSFDIAVREGILEKASGENQSRLEEQRQEYSFVHAVWRTAILNLMLEGRKRDLHSAIAQMQEAKGIEMDDYMFQMKLFSHWKASQNFAKSAELALMVGKHFEEKLGLPIQSIRLYNESLEMVRDGKDVTVGISGFTSKTLQAASRSDLTFIIRLQIALGQALSMAQQHTESVAAYQDALRILQAAKASAELRDRSILFPVFVGLSLALKRGHIVQDAECRYEQAMVRRYVQETQSYGDPIYIIHAISLQTEMYSRLGNFMQALACHKQLASVYDVDKHSSKLCQEFGSDIGALNFSLRTLWSLQMDSPEEALGTCWFVIEELMPKVNPRNVHASFMVMYPVMWVMKDNGFALEVREYFEEFVCEPFERYFGETRSTFFLPMYDPVMMLLDLSGKADVDQMMVEEYLDWALDVDNLGFGTLLNTKTGELGRTADSVAGEICYLLAQHVDNDDDRSILLQNAVDVIREDIQFTRKHRLALAEAYSQRLLASLESFDDSDGSVSSDDFLL